MSTIFTRIIEGELPGTFVWRDDRCVAILSIAPMRPGHTLVVPIAEVDKWTELDPDLAAHLIEVPHCHLHAVPIDRESDLHFENADPSAKPEDLAAAADKIRAALADAGYADESRV